MRGDTRNPYLPVSFLVSGWQHRERIVEFSRRQIAARYRGSILGALWALSQPLILLAVYTFVFSVVLRARWGDQPVDSEAPFAVFLFSGLVVYAILAECLNRSPSVVGAHAQYIRQLAFPSEILAWVLLATALFNFAMSGLILSVLYLISVGLPPQGALWIPVILVPLALATLGLSWIASAIGTYYRDLDQVMGLITTALLFLSPVFYPASRVPEAFQGFYRWNPLAETLEMTRAALFYGAPPDPLRLAVLFACGFALAWLGFVFFSQQRGKLQDAL